MASIIDERGFNQGFKLTFAQRTRLRLRAEAIVAEMRFPDAHDRSAVHILEIGCGTGELAVELAKLTNARVTGVDLSSQFIEQARQTHHHPGLDFKVADLSAPPPALDAAQYHYLVGNGILHHLYYRLPEFLARGKQWLRPGGKLVFWEPNLANPYIYLIFSYALLRRLARLEPDEMAFSGSYIRKLLQRAGYKSIEVETRDFLLPNTPTLLVGTVTRVGPWLEKVPLLRLGAQSLFIRAQME